MNIESVILFIISIYQYTGIVFPLKENTFI